MVFPYPDQAGDLQYTYRSVITVTGQSSLVSTITIHYDGWKPVAVNDEAVTSVGVPAYVNVAPGDKWIYPGRDPFHVTYAPEATISSAPSHRWVEYTSGMGVMYHQNPG